jgi:chromosome partitioning protein
MERSRAAMAPRQPAQVNKKKGESASPLFARAKGVLHQRLMQPSAHTAVQEGRRAVVCTLANQKGGMTKTTTTVNIATMLTLLGCKVLVVDCAPEAHTTFTFGYSPGSIRSTLFDVLEGSVLLKQAVLPTYCNPQTHAFFDPQEQSNPEDRRSKTLLEELGESVIHGPDLAPLNNLASSSDIALRRKMMWATLLKNTLEPARRVYDYIIIDTNPSLGVWTVNALCAADYALIPLVPEQLAVLGISDLLASIREAQSEANRSLKIAGVLFTKVKNLLAHRDIMVPLREQLSGELHINCFRTEIKENTAFLNAANRRSVVVIDDPLGDHAIAYWQVLAELLAVIDGPGKTTIDATVRGLEAERQRIAEEKRVRRESIQRERSASL